MKHKEQKGFSLIELLIVVAIIGIVAAIAIPSMVKAQQAARETAAAANLKQLGNAEPQYQLTKGHGAYGSLQDLGTENFIDSDFAAGKKEGYVFTADPVTSDNGPPEYDATAKPLSTGKFGTGNQSYGLNETNTLYEADGSVDIKGTPTDRRPANGNIYHSGGNKPGAAAGSNSGAGSNPGAGAPAQPASGPSNQQ
jgi:type IV pilus assembly protein PilA